MYTKGETGQTRVHRWKKSLTKTGGGPPLPEMSVTSQGIVDMMSDLASFSGIPGASNCESCISGKN